MINMIKLAFFDVDGTLSAPQYLVNGKLQIGMSDTQWQNKVETEEELNSIGYFDIYNLSATSNFYFNDKGIVWSYKPQELTVDANAEPTILIPFAELAPYVKENSIINTLL